MGCLVAIKHPFVPFVNDEITVALYNYADVVPWSATPSRERIKEVMAHYHSLSYGPHFNFKRETAPEGLPEALREAGCALESRKYVMFQHEPLDPPVPADVRMGETGPEDMRAAGRLFRDDLHERSGLFIG